MTVISLFRSILFCLAFTLLFMALVFVKAMFPVLPDRWLHTIMLAKAVC